MDHPGSGTGTVTPSWFDVVVQVFDLNEVIDVTQIEGREPPPQGGDGGAPPSLTTGVDMLAALAAAAEARHAAEVALVDAVAAADRAGVAEPLEGLPMDLLLAVEYGWTAAERRMLLDAGEVLAAMPATRALFAAGRLSWSQVRDVVGRVRRLGREGREVVDERLAVSIDLVDRMDPDQVGWAVQDAVDDVLAARVKESAEDAADRDTFLAIQLGLDGRGRLYGELSAADTATVVGGLDRTASRADADGDRDAGDDGHDAGGEGHGGARRCRRSRATRRGRALVDLCAGALDGRTTTGRRVPAKPLLIVHVPLDRIEQTATGLLDLAVAGPLPTVSARTVEALAADADVQAVVFDGARPLAVTARVRADDIPTDTRTAVAARDLGSREPGRRTPAGLGHVHHLDVERGHDPDNLVTISSRWHLRVVHRHGWHGHLDPTGGGVAWTRRGRTIRTVPHHTRLRPRPEHDE